jgi:hypothetical protein
VGVGVDRLALKPLPLERELLKLLARAILGTIGAAIALALS